MAKLAVFDFDHTIVDEDSDAIIISRLREKRPPPEYDSGTRDWTPYMSVVFEHAFSAGFHPSEILDSIASMRPTPGMRELITTLAEQGWDVVILTDANTVFVNHWIKTNELQDAITTIVTNRAFWQNDRLFIEPCMRQTSCRLCPSNLCKSIALAQICKNKNYTRVVYSGDGRNDFCPSTKLLSNGTVFPRKGYPLDELIKKSLATPEPQIKAKVVPWIDAYTIINELFPK
ncbi:pyridoxal phosphate phosphatase PHOSPHO2-like isoform X1 [Pieris brassicae]|uniref:Pyridoxal phosphate phosphatase phospho2 n=1 Tax=Pieris brassicae TaxID=7116 RepID=A0A9P0XIS6_PIEBR|nr:pyridoxal phosphate phosphatase PHOSPHO2-like isoform X1 [Pieris brassicae]CAH4036016.1 unnamed protein product [Pieris brassicae]